MRRPVIVGVALLATVLVGAACDNGDSGGLSRSEFVSQAEDICRAGNERIEALADEAFSGISQGEQPDAEELAAFKDAVVADVRGQIDDLRDLDPPGEMEGDVEEFLDEAETAADEVDAMSVEELFAQQEDPFAEVNERANELGLEECGAGGDESADDQEPPPGEEPAEEPGAGGATGG